MPQGVTDRWVHPAVILVATDLGDLDRLMQFALQQAAQTGARLVLLHVLPGGAGMSSDATGMPYYDPVGARDYAAGVLRPWCDMAREKNVPCDAVVREGNAAQQIEASVRQFHADRVLLGTRSRSKVSKLLLGSVAEQVLRSVHSPVITVGPEAYLPVGSSGDEQVVLHATTLGETSRPSAVLACRVAAAQRSRLVLLHVLPAIYEARRRRMPPELDAPILHEMQALATSVLAELPGCRVTVESRVAHGNPSIEILAASADLRASLIVLSAPQRNLLRNLTHDSTIYRVLAHARCPVLTLCEVPAAPSPETEPMAFHFLG